MMGEGGGGEEERRVGIEVGKKVGFWRAGEWGPSTAVRKSYQPGV